MSTTKEIYWININNKWSITLRGVLLIFFGISLFFINKDNIVNILLLAIFPFLTGVFGLHFLNQNVIVGPIFSNWLPIESLGDSILACVF